MTSSSKTKIRMSLATRLILALRLNLQIISAVIALGLLTTHANPATPLQANIQRLSPAKPAGVKILIKINALLDKASKSHQAGRYREAIVIADKARLLAETNFGPDHPENVAPLSILAEAQTALGQFKKAEQNLVRALKLLDQTGDSENLNRAVVLIHLGELNRYQNQYKQAEARFIRAIALLKSVAPAGQGQLAKALDNLGKLYRRLGEYGKAEDRYKRSLEILGRQSKQNKPAFGETLNNLGVVYYMQQRYGDAEKLFKRSIAIKEEFYGPNHIEVGRSINNLGALYRQLDRFTDAEPLYRRALQIRELVFGKKHWEVAQSLNNLALLYRMQGGCETGSDPCAKAELLYLRSLKMRRETLGANHPHVADSLNNLAGLYRAQRKFARSRIWFEKAYALRKATLLPDHPDLIGSLVNFARLAISEDNWHEAAQNLREAGALHVVRLKRSGVAQSGSSSRERRFRQRDFHALLSSLWRVGEKDQQRHDILANEAFLIGQRLGWNTAAASLAQMTARSTAGNKALSDNVRRRQDLSNERRGINKIMMATLSAADNKQNRKKLSLYRQRVGIIDRKIHKFSKDISTDFPKYTAFVDPEPLDIKQVQNLLGADEALILFADRGRQKLLPAETFVWAITHSKARWVRAKIGTTELQSMVNKLRKGLDPSNNGTRAALLLSASRDNNSFDARTANVLYKSLFGDIESLIKDKKNLLIVPSGPLTSLPLHVLVTTDMDASKDYRKVSWLVRRHAITTLPSVISLSVLHESKKRKRAAKSFIGFADPVFGKKDLQTSRLTNKKLVRDISSFYRGGQVNQAALENLAALPDTADEVLAIAKSAGADATVWLGVNASETRVKQLALDDYRIIHFATHGLVAGELKNLAEPALALSVPQKPDQIDDGLLTASEVSLLKLNSDWVLLSACNTAAGDKGNGEALSGLARAFFYAGARSLLVSHWPVVSKAAVSLTTGLFEKMARDQTMGRSDALRHAMLEMINKGSRRESHPSYWAPFVVVGEWGSHLKP